MSFPTACSNSAYLPDPGNDRVAARCSAYQEGFVLLLNIKAKGKQFVPRVLKLEGSLARGETAVKELYVRTQKYFGQVFTTSDSKVSTALIQV